MSTKFTNEYQTISFKWLPWQKLGKFSYYYYLIVHMRETMSIFSLRSHDRSNKSWRKLKPKLNIRDLAFE